MSHSSLSVAREIAYDAFALLLKEDMRATAAIAQVIEQKGAKGKQVDKEMVKDILFGSLRWHSKLFWILQNTSKRKLNETSVEIQAALVCGTYQIYYMERVPDRVAVNESVEYVRLKGQASACSFINGILRQIARRAEYFQKPDKDAKPIEYLSLQYAHPDWLVKRWSKQFKFDRLQTILAFHNQRPPLTARCNMKKINLAEIKTFQQQLLKDERMHTEKKPLRSALILKDTPRTDKDSLYQQGYYTFQDEAAQLADLLVQPEEKQHIVVAYALKGKRLSHLMELAPESTQFTAVCETAEWTESAKKELSRMGSNKVEWVTQEFLDWHPSTQVDKILLYPPNTELGKLRRVPELKLHLKEAELKACVAMQEKMLAHALTLLKPGGELIYVVDSFEQEETIHQLEQAKKKFGAAVEVVSPLPRIPDYYKKFVTREHLLLIYSGNQVEMDGLGAFVLKLINPITRT